MTQRVGYIRLVRNARVRELLISASVTPQIFLEIMSLFLIFKLQRSF
jgi:hypothetical protein